MEKIIPLDTFPNVPLLFGTYNRNIKLMSRAFKVNIIARDNLKVQGTPEAIEKIVKIVTEIETRWREHGKVNANEVEKIIADLATEDISTWHDDSEGKYPVRPRTPGQEAYMRAIQNNDIIFAIGPSGTGKTYLAVAMALEALRQGYVRRIILVRPAVEAGEKLGFLPGDFQAKIDPYLRPIYDALHDLIGYDKLKKYMEKDVIEIAPLAYMRGRTLESSFIILDEAQNTTMLQMKMFLTRLGINSKMVVTGDITQIDLPKREYCGLIHAQQTIKNIPGVSFFYLTPQDIVRHPIVQQVIQAYESAENGDNAR
jgi:phosphate starvation-inducible PhoH-like protein